MAVTFKATFLNGLLASHVEKSKTSRHCSSISRHYIISLLLFVNTVKFPWRLKLKCLEYFHWVPHENHQKIVLACGVFQSILWKYVQFASQHVRFYNKFCSFQENLNIQLGPFDVMTTAREHVCLCMVNLCWADCLELHTISCSKLPPTPPLVFTLSLIHALFLPLFIPFSRCYAWFHHWLTAHEEVTRPY